MTAIKLDECTLPQRRLILALRAAADAARIDRETLAVEGEGAGADRAASTDDPAAGFAGATNNQPTFAAKPARFRRMKRTDPAVSSAGSVEEVAGADGEPQQAD